MNRFKNGLHFRTLVKVISYTGTLVGVTLFVSAIVKWLITTFWSAKRRRSNGLSPSSVHEDGDDQELIIYLPLPWFNGTIKHVDKNKDRVNGGDGNSDDQVLKQPQKMDVTSMDPVNYRTQVLNHMSQAFDFLHRNYMNYRFKHLNRIPSYVLQKRLKVIMIEQKVELARELLMQDLRDMIEKCNLQILIQKQQIRELRNRLPPKLPFLFKSKYAPYYWILTDLDYRQMSPTLRNVLLFNGPSSRSLYPRGHSSYSMYDRSEQFQFTEQDEAELDYFLFVNPNTTIPQRYNRLKAVWIERETATNANNSNIGRVIENEQRDLFAEYCFKLLKQRARVIVRKIRRIRRIEMRNTIRERSKYLSELSLCSRLHLIKSVPQESALR